MYWGFADFMEERFAHTAALALPRRARADVPRSSRISLRCKSIQFRVNIGRR